MDEVGPVENRMKMQALLDLVDDNLTAVISSVPSCPFLNSFLLEEHLNIIAQRNKATGEVISFDTSKLRQLVKTHSLSTMSRTTPRSPQVYGVPLSPASPGNPTVLPISQ